MKKFLPSLVIVPTLFLVSCNSTGSLTVNTITTTPLEHPVTEIASPTPAELPTTEVASPTPTNLPATDTPTPQPIVYYYFVEIDDESPPEGSVVILPDILILGPTLSDVASSPDPTTNIGSALQAMINDPRNAWTGTDLSITSININDGAAKVVIQGKLFAPGDIVLIAAWYQFLLTVFAEAPVQTATIMINNKNIANLGSSDPFQIHPDDYAYTRAAIETFMAENAYEMP